MSDKFKLKILAMILTLSALLTYSVSPETSICLAFTAVFVWVVVGYTKN